MHLSRQVLNIFSPCWGGPKFSLWAYHHVFDLVMAAPALEEPSANHRMYAAERGELAGTNARLHSSVD